jgi:hypothetical protein
VAWWTVPVLVRKKPLAGTKDSLLTARAAVVVLLLAAAVAAPCLIPAAATADTASAAKAKRLTATQRAKIRRSLARQVHRNPGVVLKRSFMKRAALVEFKLPTTVRLGRSDGAGGWEASDDVIEVTWDDSVVPWPLAGGMPPAPQNTFLSGQFTLEASMSDDSSGYGELGAMETIQGGKVAMTASPFTISEFQPVCGTDSQVEVPAGTDVTVTSAGTRFGLMNLFSGAFRGSLYLRMSFPSQITDTCGGTAGTSAVVDNSLAPPMPVRFNGNFQMSPAVTADGQVRVGRITIDDTLVPQTSNFSYVRACTNVLTCDAQQFPARLKVKRLTAEVLLGDV